jgi:hypothetical protein
VGEWQPILWIKNIQGKFLASETLIQITLALAGGHL